MRSSQNKTFGVNFNNKSCYVVGSGYLINLLITNFVINYLKYFISYGII